MKFPHCFLSSASVQHHFFLAFIRRAAVNNHVQVVKYLGSISRYFVNQTTEYSQTALVLAAERGHINVVKELLNLKADFEISDDSGRTVLHYAIDFPAILKILLKVRYP